MQPLPKKEVLAVLHAYHQALGSLIFEFEGTVGPLFDDRLMVLFNDPLPTDDPAGQAVRLALAMRERMVAVLQEWRKIGQLLHFGVAVRCTQRNDRRRTRETECRTATTYIHSSWDAGDWRRGYHGGRSMARHRHIGGGRRTRRSVLTGLARLGMTAAGLALLDGCAQPFWDRRPAVARVGLLTAYPHDSALLARYYEAFMTGMRELGWIEGQNVAFFPRYLDDGPLPELAAELVRLPVDVIVTLGAADAAQAARSATSTLPIVFPGIGDPVADGLVVSLAHPGGNMTGPMLSSLQDPKHIELLESAMPNLAHLAVLFNPAPTSAPRIVSELEQSATTAGIQTQRIAVRSADDLLSAFAQARVWPAQALWVLSNSLVINPNYALIADLALRGRLPSITAVRPYAEAGGLMTYGPSIPAQYIRAASYVDRILRGAKPGDLPVERPTVFEFVVNLKTVQALGISFPPDVAGQVTEWIQ